MEFGKALSVRFSFLLEEGGASSPPSLPECLSREALMSVFTTACSPLIARRPEDDMFLLRGTNHQRQSYSRSRLDEVRFGCDSVSSFFFISSFLNLIHQILYGFFSLSNLLIIYCHLLNDTACIVVAIFYFSIGSIVFACQAFDFHLGFTATNFMFPHVCQCLGVPCHTATLRRAWLMGNTEYLCLNARTHLDKFVSNIDLFRNFTEGKSKETVQFFC